MKINEFSGWSKESKPSNNNANQPSFENWLSKGDAYYRNHQTQFQKSDLHFDASPITTHRTPLLLPMDKHTAFASSKPQATKEYTVYVNSLNDSTTFNDKAYASNEKFTPFIKELEQSIEQTASFIAAMNKRLTIEPQTAKSPIPKPEPIAINEFEYKNNHLYLSGKQAELTLNLKHFNKQEQKDLINLLQKHFRQKGLVIRQLIINGVNHD